MSKDRDEAERAADEKSNVRGVRRLGVEDGDEYWMNDYGDIWTRRFRTTERPAAEEAGSGGGSCPSITNPQTRQGWPRNEAVCEIDWLELAGSVQWGVVPALYDLAELESLKTIAGESRKSQPLPFMGFTTHVRSNGIGSGRDSHKEYALECEGIVIGLSARPQSNRQLHNFYLRVPGTACLLMGVDRAWDIAYAVVGALGGRVVDEWIRRIDIALDVPGLCLRDELLPAFEREQFRTTAKRWATHRETIGTTGFHLGNADRWRLTVYDKLHEVRTKNDVLYQRGMLDRRWFGNLPDAATRIEWQIGREYLREYGIDGASQLMADLSPLVDKLTSYGPHPQFCMTDCVPDRENRHQDRAGVHPLWHRICETVREWSGNPTRTLQRIRREDISDDRAFAMIVGCVTSFADRRGVVCESFEDGLRLIREMHAVSKGTDAQWLDSWEKKAKRSGTYDRVMKFDADEFESKAG